MVQLSNQALIFTLELSEIAIEMFQLFGSIMTTSISPVTYTIDYIRIFVYSLCLHSSNLP